MDVIKDAINPVPEDDAQEIDETKIQVTINNE
jgi:hypothetical protein